VQRGFNKRIVLITGELSGELHALNLIKAITKDHPFRFSGMGGSLLKDAGVEVVYDYRAIAITGISEVFSRLHHIYMAFKRIKQHIRKTKPGLIILVDFPGFNLRIARFAKRHNIPVIYFIPPQIWAWRRERIKQIKRYVDKVICILPFERPIYDKEGIAACYVGHPFIDSVKPRMDKEKFLNRFGIDTGRTIITIMPGSREDEVKRHMPVMVEVVARIKGSIKGIKVIIPLAEGIDKGMVDGFVQKGMDVLYLNGLSHDALSHSDLAIIASGSATLEAAIIGTPAIVIYKVSLFSYIIARLLVKVRYISLPNIILGKEVFPEFIQHIDPDCIAEKAIYMLNNGKDMIKEESKRLRALLGGDDPYNLATEAVLEFIEERYGAISEAT
jgi:lipid-A-disaccharide synthase